MNLFRNTVTLRGFLAKDAEVPTSDHIQQDSFAVLVLGIASGTWKKQTYEWIPRTEWLRIICPGPFLCGFTRGMRRGEYLEVEGELHLSIAVDSAAPRHPQQECRIYATQIRRLEYPAVGVDEGEDG